MTRLLFLGIFSLSLFGQVATVAISKEAPNTSTTTYFFKNAGGNPQYICKARSTQFTYTWAITPSPSQGTLTSIVVASNVGTVTTAANHGLNINNSVVVSGSTTVALNKAYVIQTGGAVSGGSATAFTITTSGVSDGTYSTANLAVSTTAPRTNAVPGIWSIEQYSYDSTGFPIMDQFANGNTAQTSICDSRSTLGYE